MFEWDETRSAGTRRTIPSPRRMTRTWTSCETDPGAVRALAYDVVLNGTELGSGSIRIHRQDIQSKIFTRAGHDGRRSAQARFGFFLEALEYGTPPHGGIALGLDRIVMILAGADSLREVIPFPKTAQGHRPDGGRADAGERDAVEGPGDQDQVETDLRRRAIFVTS